MMRSFFASLSLLALSMTVIAQDNILFNSFTEDSTEGWDIPSEDIAKLVTYSDQDLRQSIDDKIQEDQLKPNYSQFLALKKIALATSGPDYLFVRPRSDVYSPFYGAHIYRYWLLDTNNNIIFSSSDDAFNVLKDVTNGMHNIESINCFGANGCFNTTFAFINSQYQQISCHLFDSLDEEITKPCK